MDWTVFTCAIGLIFTGFIIGYPFGHAMCKRSLRPKCESLPLPSIVCASRRRLDSNDILSAEILEVKKDVS